MVGQDGFSASLGCHPLVGPGPQFDPGRRSALQDRAGEIRRRPHEKGTRASVQQLVTLAEEARSASYPVLACDLHMTAANLARLDGGSELLSLASEQLDACTGNWLEAPAAINTRADLLFNRAWLQYAKGDLSGAWHELEQSLELSRQIGDDVDARLTVTLQSRILEELGHPRDAARRLSQETQQAAILREDEYLPFALGQLAWLVAIDPEADQEELERARDHTKSLLEDGAFAGAFAKEKNPLGRANQLVNLTLLETRLAAESGAAQEAAQAAATEARTLLAEDRSNSEYTAYLAAWLSLMDGLRANSPVAAERLCQPLAEHGDRLLASFALDCVARAAQERGQLERAFATRLRLTLGHDARSFDIGAGLDPGLSQRSIHFARAAKLAVDLDRPGQAWELLERLDALRRSETLRKQCRAQLEEGSPEAERWKRHRKGVGVPLKSA